MTPSATPTVTALVVNTSDDTDDGMCDAVHCSLREAIDAADAHPGPDTIHFSIPNGAPGCDASGVCTIQPTRLLPFLTDDGTTIDGYTQSGAQSGDQPVLKIVLDGHDNGEYSGLVIRSANNVIRGLVIQRFTPFSGIHVQQATATDDHRRRQLIVAALHEADAPCGAGVDAVAGDGVAARAAFRNTSFTLPPIPTAEPSMPS